MTLYRGYIMGERSNPVRSVNVLTYHLCNSLTFFLTFRCSSSIYSSHSNSSYSNRSPFSFVFFSFFQFLIILYKRKRKHYENCFIVTKQKRHFDSKKFINTGDAPNEAQFIAFTCIESAIFVSWTLFY